MAVGQLVGYTKGGYEMVDNGDGTYYTADPKEKTIGKIPEGSVAVDDPRMGASEQIANLAGAYGMTQLAPSQAATAASSLAPYGYITDSAGTAIGIQGAPMGAEAAAVPAAEGLGLGPLAAIAGATYLGGKAGYDMLKGKKPDLPGRVVLGMATGGLSEVANFAGNKLFGKSNTRGEQHQRDRLIEEGIPVPIHETARDGKAWELNPIFAESRKESDLTGADIKDASDFYALIPNYQKLSNAQREKTAQQALNLGLVQEKLGKINVGLKDSPEYQKWVDQMMATVGQPTAAPQTDSGENKRARDEEKKRQRKEQALSMLALSPQENLGTRYDFNEIIKNPYAK